MNLSEQDAAKELRQVGLKSAWGCGDGVFLSSGDALRVANVVTKLSTWLLPQTRRESFNEVREILSVITGQSDVSAANNNDKSGRNFYIPEVADIDLG